MINLGGDGQMVVGGLVGATASLLLPAPGPLAATLALIAATVAGGLYAALAAWGQIRFAIPMLISSLLLSYTAVGIVSYLVRFPLRDTTTGLPQTALVPVAARLPTLVGPVNAGMLVIAAVEGAPLSENCTSAFCTAIAATPSMPAMIALVALGSMRGPAAMQRARKPAIRMN